MQSKATTVKQYLNSLPEDRREAIEAVRAAVNAGLPILDGSQRWKHWRNSTIVPVTSRKLFAYPSND